MHSEQIHAASGFCSNICPSCLSPNDTVCIKCSSSVWSKHSLQHTTEFIYNSDGKIYNDLWGEMSMNMFRNAKKKKDKGAPCDFRFWLIIILFWRFPQNRTDCWTQIGSKQTERESQRHSSRFMINDFLQSSSDLLCSSGSILSDVPLDLMFWSQ